ncbi:uridine kinase [Parafrankia sp. EUN1f]|uniref:uridine kinase n=1 Tax=Parafrankia sp. EUN1f TaxID=102897 RepID=UPI0001C45A34|nr:uridine kinase [Parafrankia sp. EUN1f]EFC83244.1 pantothenate kinase protein [Parafrankia sp. EUN1f]
MINDPASEPSPRDRVVSSLADLLLGTCPDRVLRVAIDGPDAAGKTTLADELAGILTDRGRPVIRASVDGFHQPQTTRRRRGSLSPQGYFLDAFDYTALRRHLLDPLSPAGDRRYRTAAFDHLHDSPLDSPAREAPSDAVLIVDGVFLLRDQLRSCWDLTVFLQISPAESLRRALQRDVALFGSPATVRERYEARYLPGQQLYQASAAPREHAHGLIDHELPEAPHVLRWPE